MSNQYGCNEVLLKVWNSMFSELLVILITVLGEGIP